MKRHSASALRALREERDKIRANKEEIEAVDNYKEIYNKPYGDNFSNRRQPSSVSSSIQKTDKVAKESYITSTNNEVSTSNISEPVYKPYKGYYRDDIIDKPLDIGDIIGEGSMPLSSGEVNNLNDEDNIDDIDKVSAIDMILNTYREEEEEEEEYVVALLPKKAIGLLTSVKIVKEEDILKFSENKYALIKLD